MTPIFVDATILYRWRHLAPVGIIRLERMLASHLRFSSQLPPAQYVMWDRGYRPATEHETHLLDDLLSGAATKSPLGDVEHSVQIEALTSGRGIVPRFRRAGLRGLARLPDHLRPFGEQAFWALATFGIESGRYVRRARVNRSGVTSAASDGVVRHTIEIPEHGADLVAMGLGWEYVDPIAMFELKERKGLRIHMPAFDLICTVMPQMNVGQSHLVHRFYAEMAHYANSITSISEATTDAVRNFFTDEDLPMPRIATNPLPAFDPPTLSRDPDQRAHRFEDEDFVLSVSTVEVRKNHLLLAKIWAECIREGHDMPRMVLVGRIGWDVNELMQWAFHAPELNDRFTILSDVEDDELTALYQDALFTVFPSRIEGWGLPITEALALGKVCVHSDDPAQLEASQGLMPTLHPDDFFAWKSEILRLCTDPRYRRELERVIENRFVRRTPAEYCVDFERILTEQREGTR